MYRGWRCLRTLSTENILQVELSCKSCHWVALGGTGSASVGFEFDVRRSPGSTRLRFVLVWNSPSLTLGGVVFWHGDSIPVTNGNGLSKTER
jgi:hypothetical protein